MAHSLGIEIQRNAGDSLRLFLTFAGRRKRNREIKQLAHDGSYSKDLLSFVAAYAEDEVIIWNELLGAGTPHHVVNTRMEDPVPPVPPCLLVLRDLHRQV